MVGLGQHICLAGIHVLSSFVEVAGKPTNGRIVIGGAVQLSGKYEIYGTQAKNVTTMWKELLDADDGFPFDITLNFADDGSNSDNAVALDEQMLLPRDKNSPDVLICPYTSGSSKAVCNMLDEKNISVICGIWGGASETIFDYPKIYSGQNLRVQSLGRAGNYFTSGLEFAFRQFGAPSPSERAGRSSSPVGAPPATPTAALIYRQTDAFSNSLCKGAKTKAEELGFDITLYAAVDPLTNANGEDSVYQQMKDSLGKVPFVDLYDVTANAMKPLVEGLELADVIVGCGLYDSQTAIVLGLIARRIRPPFTILTNAFDGRLMASALPINMLDVFMPSQWSPALPGSDEVFGASMDFYRGYKARFGKGPTYHGAQVGGLLTMLTRALLRTADVHSCGDDGECELNAAALRAAFVAPELDKDTFFGRIEIDEYGMNENKSLIQEQLQLGGGGSFVHVPAVPVEKIPPSWVPEAGAAFPRWPARSWSRVKTDFLNSYCGSAGFYVSDFDVLRVVLELENSALGTFEYPDVGECTPCANGTMRPPNFAECYECPTGTFAAIEGQSECDLCPEGSAMDRTGALRCVQCAPGTVAGEKGLKVCQQCTKGRYMPEEGLSECWSCPVGRYQPQVGQGDCVACADAAGASMITTFPGASNASQCLCPEGTFFNAQGECSQCPPGMTCSAGTGVPLVKPGNWALSSDNAGRVYSVYRCRNSLECPGGPAGTCAEGRDPDSLGCSDCFSGYTPIGDGHSCEKCKGLDVAPLIVTALLCVAGLAALTFYSTVDVAKSRMNTLVVLAILGQIVVAIQWLSIFQGMELEWVEPFETVLKIASVFAFRFETLKMGCLLPDSSVVPVFLVRLLIFPVGAGVLVSMMWCYAKFQRRALDPNRVANSLGFILLVLFLSLTMVAFTPFICVDSPNGKMTMSSNPSVICDGNKDFIVLSILAIGGIMLYSVTPMALVGWVTIRYPSMLSSGQSSIIMSRYRFLFQRFKVDYYYYAAIYLLRNFFMALVPVVMANHAHLQIVTLAAMFIFFGIVSAWLKPWRGSLPNVLEVIFMALFALTFNIAGMVLDVDGDKVALDMQVILSIVLAAMMASFAAIVGYLGHMRLNRSSVKYGAFLSHHKMGMAVGSRFVKMELGRRTTKPIFLDSDELDDLDGILDTVRSDVGCLIVLLTTETLWRPWCAGEIATAHLNDVPIVCVDSDGYREPADEDLELTCLENRWSTEDFAPMALQGVTFGAVRNAYLAVRDMEKIQWKRTEIFLSGRESVLERVADKICASCNSKVKCSGDQFRQVARPTQQSAEDAAADTEILVLANGEDGEAICGAYVLSRMLVEQTQLVVMEVFRDEGMCQKYQRPQMLVVSLTKGAIHSEVFASTVVAASKAWGTTPALLTTRSPDFQFPVREVLERSTYPSLAASNGVAVQDIAAAFAPVLSSLALPFFPSGRLSLMAAEVAEVADRVQRLSAVSPRPSQRSQSEVSLPVSPGAEY